MSMTSNTYLHNKRYLELNAKCRLTNRFPDSEENQFATSRDEIVGLGFLTEAEYDERAQLARDYFDLEIKRLEECGNHAQADQIRKYMETPGYR